MKLSERNATSTVEGGFLHIVIPDGSAASGFSSYKIATDDLLARGDNYVDGVSFNTADGVLTLERTGELADLTQSLDGRFSLSDHKHYQLYQPDETNPFVYTDNGGALHVDGDIIQNGSAYETHLEQVFTKNDYITLRDGAVGGLGVGQYAGFTAKLYDGINDGQLVFDKDGWARVGDVGNLQKLAAIEENTTNGYIMKYDASGMRLVGVQLNASYISDFDTEVSNNLSVVANTAKITNATHTGEVTGSVALTISNGVVDNANLETTLAARITANDAKISSQWTNVTGGITYGGKVGIGKTSLGNARLDILGTGQDVINVDTASDTTSMIRIKKNGVELGSLYALSGSNDFNIRNPFATGGLNFQTGGSGTKLSITSTGAATFSNTVTATQYYSDDVAGTFRGLNMRTAGLPRWGFLVDNATESGSNVGANLGIYRYADNGAYLGRTLTVLRTTGAATFENTVTATDFIIA